MLGREQFRQAITESISEVVAGIFCSKRHTGQFYDGYETGEIELTVDKPELSSSSDTADSWADGIVHDFDEADEVMEWPPDFDEASEEF